jgi:5-formyltetrahydrofolate cyclo-ligase
MFLAVDGDAHPIGMDAHEPLAYEVMHGGLHVLCHASVSIGMRLSCSTKRTFPVPMPDPMRAPMPDAIRSTVSARRPMLDSMTSGRNDDDPMTTPAVDASKDAWRAWAKRVRAESNGSSARAGHASILDHLRTWDLFRRAEHVLLYLPLVGEVDLTPLITDSARSCYLTRTWPDPAEPLSIHAYDPAGLEPHVYGFAQPVATAAHVDPATIDLALIPGLAFDAAGTRLGHGRGYFDRLLAELPRSTPLVGIAPLATVVPRLPREAHDVLMDYLATESGVRAVVRSPKSRS